MLKLTWIEFFFRTVPEMFILIWGIHVISRKPFNIPQYVLSSIIMSILIFFIRWLPIYFGVHMVLNIIFTIIIMFIIGIPLIKSIYSTLLMFFILSLSEFLNMLILNLLKIDISLQLLQPVKKCVLEIPSLAIISIFIVIIHYLLKTKEGIKYVSN
ncbi:hypothetical protein [Clostridium scatologenes]|uniref:Uncharacterized protein n=1 Tax=Clostridium scatologenes TaxID=1548 RepID=A0A0E3M984_CLOSL|nr:hypothetical protein [Clostridium scatologenes]AKA69303.1 hypothetical protein CSCA_2178 [Clostridium scatologenes]